MSSTKINFSECESKIRQYYNISSSKIITFFQLEITNNNSQSLINKVEYQAYNNEKLMIDLSICNDIQIFYSIKNDTQIDFDSINSFKNLGIDVFNIDDSFFNNICQSYSEKNNDVVLEDRIKFIYKNYSLCEEGCIYNEIDLINKTISCNCRVKNNITLNETFLSLHQYNEINIDSNFGIIKCYNLVFSLKGKLHNIGFWIFLFLIVLYIPLLIIYLNKGLEPIKEYIYNEMKNNGYIDNNIGLNKRKSIETNSPMKKHNKKEKRQGENIKIKGVKSRKKEAKLNLLNLINSNNKENLNEKKNIALDTKSHKKTKRKKRKKIKGDKLIDSENLFCNSHLKNISQIQTLNETKAEKAEKEKSILNFEFNLININLNDTKKEYSPSSSNFILNNYSFEEAIQYDFRSICLVFFIFLLSKQVLFHAFLFRSPLELFPLRLSLLIFIVSSDLALNAIFI